MSLRSVTKTTSVYLPQSNVIKKLKLSVDQHREKQYYFKWRVVHSFLRLPIRFNIVNHSKILKYDSIYVNSEAKFHYLQQEIKVYKILITQDLISF